MFPKLSLTLALFVSLPVMAANRLSETTILNGNFVPGTLYVEDHKAGAGDTVAHAFNIHRTIVNGVSRQLPHYSHPLDGLTDRVFISQGDSPRPTSVAWTQDKSTLYAINFGDERTLVSIDPSSGTENLRGTLTGLLADHSADGIAIDETGQCYVISTNHETESALYRCNLSNGQLSLVGTQTMAFDIHDIVATCTGKIIGYDYRNKLYEINKTDGSATLIGDLIHTGTNNSIDGGESIAYDRSTGQLYQYVVTRPSGSPFTSFAKINGTTLTTEITSSFTNGTFTGDVRSSCEDANNFNITAGLNGTWFTPETAGQGFNVDVYKDTNLFFMSWFTFDTVMADPSLETEIGHPDQVWLTASGPIDGASVLNLDIYSSSGGLFNDPATVSNEKVGEMTVSFVDCLNGVVEYEFTDSGMSGSIAIQRVAGDNVALCESLAGAVTE